MIITIDGPSASGKSTISYRLAQRLNGYYLCSGLLFRGLAYVLHAQHGYDAHSIAAVTKENILSVLDHMLYSYTHNDGAQIFFDDKDITIYLKDTVIDQLASVVGTHSFVRQCLEQMQHAIVEKALQSKDITIVIVDGRDSGSVVFPHADYKWYITASSEVRAQRMLQSSTYKNASSQDALHAITMRDVRDEKRTLAPLRVPEGAMVIDTSNMTIDEVINNIELFMKNK